jgi:hypothetical protein
VSAFVFREQYAIGQTGESVIREYLRDEGFLCYPVSKVQDLCGIDLIVYRQDGTSFTIQVKTERYDHTGNVALEVWSNLERCIRGGHRTSKADYFVHVFPASRRVLFLDGARCRAWLEAAIKAGHLYLRNVLNEEYTTVIAAVSIVCLKSEGVIIDDARIDLRRSSGESPAWQHRTKDA